MPYHISKDLPHACFWYLHHLFRFYFITSLTCSQNLILLVKTSKYLETLIILLVYVSLNSLPLKVHNVRSGTTLFLYKIVPIHVHNSTVLHKIHLFQLIQLLIESMLILTNQYSISDLILLELVISFKRTCLVVLVLP